MSIRKNLISDIKIFVENAKYRHNNNIIVDSSKYFDLKERISSLVVDDFESEEYYNYFLRYTNEPNRKTELYYFEKIFTQDNFEIGPFLFMCNYLNGVNIWLEKN